MMRRVLVPLLPALLLVGCGADTGGPSDPGTADDPTPGGGRVSGDYVADGLPSPFEDGDSLRVTFGGGSISFQATCNTMSGNASWDDGVLAVDHLGGTEMGCPGKGHQQDEWLVEFLSSAPAISVDGTDVRLKNERAEIWLVPADEVAPDPGPDVSLVGTRWQLVGIEETDGDASSITVVERYGAELTVGRKSIGFDTGCNTGGGDARLEGDRLRFRNVVTTLRACLDERSQVEDGVMAVLGERWVDWSITGQELRLTHGDTTLVYRAK